MKKRPKNVRIAAGHRMECESLEAAQAILAEVGKAARLEGWTVVFVRDFILPMDEGVNSSPSTRRGTSGVSCTSGYSYLEWSGASSKVSTLRPIFEEEEDEEPGEEMGI